MFDGVSRCARYAFGPNKLHLCGPDANREVLSYLNAGVTDFGLKKILGGFATLYPYLETIAHANGIEDPFDVRVVHAYWIGNPLLETISNRTFFRHLAEKLNLKRKYNYKQKEMDSLTAKLPKGARMHHSFHVLNAHKRTGFDEVYHTIDSMDACRISWGNITAVSGTTIVVKRKPLLLREGALYLGKEEEFKIRKRLDDFETDDMEVGDIVSIHWSVPCEKITQRDARMLEHYTNLHIALANTTL